MLCDEHEKIIFLINKCSSGFNSTIKNTPISFASLWKPIANKAVQIYNYSQLHKVILQQKDVSVNEFVQSYEQLALTLVQKENQTLTNNDRDGILLQFNYFKNSIINLNIKLEQIIIKR